MWREGSQLSVKTSALEVPEMNVEFSEFLRARFTEAGFDQHRA